MRVQLGDYGDVVTQPFWFPSSSLQLQMVAVAGRYLVALNKVGAGRGRGACWPLACHCRRGAGGAGRAAALARTLCRWRVVT